MIRHETRLVILFVTIFFCSQAYPNLLLNPDFEDLSAGTVNNGNNIGYAVPNWSSTGSSLNLVQIDGVTSAIETIAPYSDYVYGGFWLPRANAFWHYLGPQTDADNSGPGISKHYVDIVGGTATLFQTFTVPVCANGSSSAVVDYGASYSNRENRNAAVRVEMFDGAGLGTQLQTTGNLPLTGGLTSVYNWEQLSNTITLNRGQTYTFATVVTDFANVDNAFVVIQPSSSCGRTVGSTGGTAEYLQARNTMLLTYEPDRHRRLDKINRSRSLSGANKPTERLPFDLMLNGSNAIIATSAGRLDASDELGAWDFWIEGYLSGFMDDAKDVGLFGVGYAGVDYQLSNSVLIGMLFQLDHLDLDFDTLGDSINGTGWMVGPYVTVKLHEKLFFDLRGAWGQSGNSIEAAGSVSGKFNSDRWLLSGALVGEIQHGNWEIRPELQAKYISEHQNAF